MSGRRARSGRRSGMHGPESKFWKKIRANTQQVRWQRLESPSTGGGIPDVVGAYKGTTAFIELKAVTRGWRVKFEPEQPVWLHKWAQAGGVCWVACERGQELYLWRGQDARKLRGEDLRTVEPALHWEYRSDWDWDILVDTVFR